jgi:PAS domain S-box-containing protein
VTPITEARRPQVRRPDAPTGVEREFGREQIIVSKTDLKGRITYANDVFCAVSGYAEGELIGVPHNVIRHPDMPMAVFQLMWDTITTGEEIFAYVVNLAADGRHYWVFAHITPSFGPDGAIVGYHSNRRWVPPQVRRQMAALYADIRRAEAGDAPKKARIAAGVAALTERLAGRTYDEFIWSIAGEEVGR